MEILTWSIQKYHNEASTITAHLLAYFYQVFKIPVLSIFLLFYQYQALLCIWVDSQPLFEKKELEEANKIEFDFLIPIEEDKEKKNKRVRIYEKDEVMIRSLKTSDYINSCKDDEIDLSSTKSI